MKRLFILACLSLTLLAACNSDGTNSTASKDSATTQTTTTENTATTPPATDNSSAPVGNASMMDLMSKNMQDMKAMPSSGNPDNDFASMMKTHHLGAIDMAQLELAQGTDASLKQMAQKMIDEQQKEIAELNTFLSGHKAHGGGDAFHKEVMGKMNAMPMDMDHSGSVDKQFAQMMISHHQGAIDMSNAYVKSGAHEEKLKTMATKIIADQKKEIADLKAWLDSHK